MFKAMRSGLFRGHDPRSARWCQLFPVDLPSTCIGPDPCWYVGLCSREGKENAVSTILLVEAQFSVVYNSGGLDGVLYK